MRLKEGGGAIPSPDGSRPVVTRHCGPQRKQEGSLWGPEARGP